MEQEKLLKEILTKLEFTMAHLYLMIGDEVKTVSELYEENQKNQIEEINTLLESIALPIEVVDELITYAFNTGKYKIETDSTTKKQVMVVSKGTALTRIPMEIVYDRTSRNS